MSVRSHMVVMLSVGALLAGGAEADPLLLRYTLLVENPTQRVISDARLWAYAPMAADALHATHPYKMETDACGNRIMMFAFESLAPFQQAPIRIEARINLPAPVIPGEVACPERNRREASPVLSEYQDSPSSWLDSSDPLYHINPADLRALVPAFDAESPLDRARQIYDWVARHLRPSGYDPTDRGAAYALRHGQGDCTEFMALMVALCRHNDIPAHGAGGYRLERSGVARAADYHNWAVLLIDDTVWIADPLQRVFQEAGPPYVLLSWVGEIDNALQGHPRFRFDAPHLRVTMP